VRQDVVGAFVGLLTDEDMFVVISSLGSREACKRVINLQQTLTELKNLVEGVRMQEAAPIQKQYDILKQEVMTICF
jgi:hypothetical protein